MNEGYVIKSFIKAFEGDFNPGHISSSAPRKSDCFALYVSGSADYIFQDRTLKVNTGDAFFIPKNSLYRIDIKEKSRYICIDFDFLPTEADPCPMLFKKIGATAESLFLKALRIRSDGINLPKVLSIIYEIYHELLKRSAEKYSPRVNMDKIYSFILSNYGSSELTPKLISDSTGISESKLRRAIKSTFHLTPVKYVTLLRLEKAANLLSDSNLSVTEIAASTGFEDPFYFSRIFKKQYGLSPANFRIKEKNK